jgi:polyhydroxyalkanoate synthesis regulator phasin
MPKTKSRRKTAAAHGAAEALHSAWAQAQHALGAAQAEIEKQVKAALKRNKIGGREAAAVLKDVGARFEKERKKARAGLESQLSSLRSRVRTGGKAAGRRVGEVVEQALAALNIPSRREIADLTRKVGELSRKIDALKRRR